MSATKEQVIALVKAHISGDEERFKTTLESVLASAEAKGHRVFAASLRRAAEAAARAPRMVQLPQEVGECIEQSLPTAGLGALTLHEEVRRRIQGVITEHREAERLRAHGLSPVSRMLLSGPPGTGKTSSAAAIAAELQRPLMVVRMANVIDSHMGETAKALLKTMSILQFTQAVVVIDEVDSIGMARVKASGGVGRDMNHSLNTFLSILDKESWQGILVCTTNLLDVLDAAFVSRFPLVVSFAEPTEEMRVAFIRHCLSRHFSAEELEGMDWERLAAGAKSTNQRGLAQECESAAKAAVLSGEPIGAELVAQCFLGAHYGEDGQVNELPCCGGSDEAPPEHTRDCATLCGPDLDGHGAACTLAKGHQGKCNGGELRPRPRQGKARE